MNKSLLFICAIITLNLSAQSRKDNKIREFFWGPNDTQKNNIEVPEKWKNESAVILYEEHFYDYHNFLKKVKNVKAIRKRIKIMDAAAVKDFSEFQFKKKFNPWHGFHWGKEKKIVGIKIIKPNGEENEIDVNDVAVDLDDNERKLAISGIEVGDILDIYVYTFTVVGQANTGNFGSNLKLLSQEYPIKEFLLKLNTENDFYISFNSYNGAPKLKEVQADKASERSYVLRADDIDKNDFPRWYYPFRELPYYKFSVNYAVFDLLGQHRAFMEERDFMPEKSKVIKSRVAPNEVLTLLEDDFPIDRSKSHIKNFEEFIKGRNLSTEEYIREAYNFIRHYYHVQFIENGLLDGLDIDYKADNKDAYKFGPGDHYFFTDNLKPFDTFLEEKGVKFDYLLVLPREIGTVTDLLYAQELELFFRVHLSDKMLYFPFFSSHSSFDSFDSSFENTEAYSLSYDTKYSKLVDIQKIETPKFTHNDNVQKEISKIRLNEDFSGFGITKKSESLGHFKSEGQNDILYFFDYLDEDNKRYGNTSYIDRAIEKSKEKARVHTEFNGAIDKVKEKQKTYLQTIAESQYSTEFKNYDFKIINTGRSQLDTPFTMEEAFEISDNFIKKAGDNYVLEIGRFIGGQIALNADEKARKENVYVNYPKTFENTIEFQIPKGYEIQGIENLNITTENSTGGFVSECKIEGDRLIIYAKKYYLKYFEENKDWPLMVDFLDAAYQFSQERILLKKSKSMF